MAERISLTTPIVIPAVQTTGFEIDVIYLSRRRQRIVVTFVGDNGETREWRIEGDAAVTKLKALNTANLPAKSLDKRIMEQAIADGVFANLAPTVAGAPDV